MMKVDGKWEKPFWKNLLLPGILDEFDSAGLDPTNEEIMEVVEATFNNQEEKWSERAAGVCRTLIARRKNAQT